jgi:lactoylglutathione lyase
MSTWNRQIGAMTLMTPDLDSSKTFYQEVFGLPVRMEEPDTVMFLFTDMYVFLHKSSAAADQPPEVKELALTGAGQFAIIVDDVDAVAAELDQLGVALLSGPADRSWGMRTVTFADPGGYIWEIAQSVPGS